MLHLDWRRFRLRLHPCISFGSPSYSAFYGTFERSYLRAALDMAILVSFLEALRLLCFLLLHDEAITTSLSPRTIGAELHESWPEDLVVRFTWPGRGARPVLSHEPHTLEEVVLPSCWATCANLALSYLMRSAVTLDFFPDRPVVLFSRDTDVQETVVRAAQRHSEQSIFAVLSERSTILAYAPTGRGAQADVMTPAFSHQVLETLARTACEPFRRERVTHGGEDSDSGGVSSGYVCRRKHVARVARAFTDLSGGGGNLLAHVFAPLLLLSVHLLSFFFAYSEALVQALLTVPGIIIGAHCLAGRFQLRPLSVGKALAVCLYAQTLPLCIDGLIEGPLFHLILADAGQSDVSADGGEATTLRWALEGIEAPKLSPVFFFLLHTLLCAHAILHTLGPRPDGEPPAGVAEGDPAAVREALLRQIAAFQDGRGGVQEGRPQLEEDEQRAQQVAMRRPHAAAPAGRRENAQEAASASEAADQAAADAAPGAAPEAAPQVQQAQAFEPPVPVPQAPLRVAQPEAPAPLPGQTPQPRARPVPPAVSLGAIPLGMPPTNPRIVAVVMNTGAFWSFHDAPPMVKQALLEQSCLCIHGVAAATTAAQLGFLNELQCSAWGWQQPAQAQQTQAQQTTP